MWVEMLSHGIAEEVMMGRERRERREKREKRESCLIERGYLAGPA